MTPTEYYQPLILGLLAFQNDLVTEDQLNQSVRELSKSTSDTRPFWKHLGLTKPQFEILSKLTDEHLGRHGNDQAKALKALSERHSWVGSVSVHLDLDELAETLEPLCGSSSIEEPPSERAGSTAVTQASPNTNQFDLTVSLPGTQEGITGERFRKLSQHARGGLGEVFVAFDVELGRRVALKQIQSKFAKSDESRWRFLLEAQVTGRLEHPGIVPVYALETDPKGIPQYAMQFIEGESLQEAIDIFHTRSESATSVEYSNRIRSLLSRFIGVCQAIGYVHSRGVIHRDIKPSNIMLGQFGETLVVDWGLAKVTEQSGFDDVCPVESTERTRGYSATPASRTRPLFRAPPCRTAVRHHRPLTEPLWGRRLTCHPNRRKARSMN